MTVRRWLPILALLARASIASAVPPLAIGDVPTADPGTVELYAGVGRVKSGATEWSAPAAEVVLGVSSRQELTLEAPFLVEDGGHRGLGDLVLGTKLLVLPEAPAHPGFAASVEWKLANGSAASGTGNGSMEVGFLLRAQKRLGWLTLIGNGGYTLVGDSKVGGVAQPRRNTGFLGGGGEAELRGNLSGLADVYWRSADVAGEPARVAADVGLKVRLAGHLSAHGAVGTSLRAASLGGPALRLYVGLQADFAVF